MQYAHHKNPNYGKNSQKTREIYPARCFFTAINQCKKTHRIKIKDFDVLCSIGLFDSEKMNQGIFGFRKYENSSLSYTGIDKHEGEAIGGWDTVLRREEYEALYSKQQATMTDFENILIPEKYRADKGNDDGATAKTKNVANGTNAVADAVPVEDDSVQKALEEMLAKVEVGITVSHKKFGDGTVSWMSNDGKYIRIKFSVGEKQFVFPDSFVLGFLELK